MIPLAGTGRRLAEFSPEGFARRILGTTDRMAIVLAGFLPGQEIPAHAPHVDLVLTVLDGDGEVRIGEQVHHLRAGDLAVVPAGEMRAVRAGPGGMVALHVVSPPPTAEDHATGHLDPEWPAKTSAGADLARAISREHEALRPHLEELADLADTVSDLVVDERRRRLTEVVDFMRSELLPHAEAEEEAVYPAAETVLRARGGATRPMTLEHEAIAGLVDELGQAIAGDEVTSLGRILHSLRAVTLLHLDKEERVHLPALEGLSDEEAAAITHHLGIH